jgi:hypothetical protein
MAGFSPFRRASSTSVVSYERSSFPSANKADRAVEQHLLARDSVNHDRAHMLASKRCERGEAVDDLPCLRRVRYVEGHEHVRRVRPARGRKRKSWRACGRRAWRSASR